MKTGTKILIVLTSILTLFGVGLSIYAFYMDRASLGNLVGVISLLVGLIGTLATLTSKSSLTVAKQPVLSSSQSKRGWTVASGGVIAGAVMVLILGNFFDGKIPLVQSINEKDTSETIGLTNNSTMTSKSSLQSEKPLSVQKTYSAQKQNDKIIKSTNNKEVSQIEKEQYEIQSPEIKPDDLAAENAYEEGRKAAQKNNYLKAAKYYQSGADRGVSAAAYELALLYQKGKGVAKNESLAFKYMKIAAEADYSKAFKSIGEMYHGGWGVTKDRKMAECWYKKAADSGDEEAKKILYNM